MSQEESDEEEGKRFLTFKSAHFFDVWRKNVLMC